MDIYGFYRDHLSLKPVRIDIAIMPGMPQFHIMGLNATQARNAQVRIKTALKNQGFVFPASQQVLVDFEPKLQSHVAIGIDLAIAVAYLKASKQLNAASFSTDALYVCGDLNLQGRTSFPVAADGQLDLSPKARGLFGNGAPTDLLQHYYLAGELRDLLELEEQTGEAVHLPARPALDRELKFDRETARLMALTALGRHSIFLAGPAGSGKSTLAECLYFLMPELDQKTWRELRRWQLNFGASDVWRPLVAPHHTVPVISMVGGGSPMFAGALTRAHQGLLILDEFLEFQSAVQEALREPLESRQVRVIRQGRCQVFPADCQVVATSNLCPCGDYVPGRINNCQRSLTRCRSYLERFSGPLLDRFSLLHFKSTAEGHQNIDAQEILDTVERARRFQRDILNFKGVREHQNPNELLEEVKDFKAKKLFPEIKASKRRANAFLRVARTLADLDGSQKIELSHLAEAKNYTVYPFERIKRID